MKNSFKMFLKKYFVKNGEKTRFLKVEKRKNGERRFFSSKTQENGFYSRKCRKTS